MTLEPNPLGKQYNIRYRLCDEHLRAERVLVQGHPQRFCQARGPVECMREARGKFYKLTALNAFRVRFPSLQKCSRFHALELFEGGKRTCIKMLELQNSRRRAPDAKPKAEHLATSAQATSWALPEGMGPEAGCLRVLLHPHRAQEAPPHLCSTPAAAAAAAPDLLFAAAQRTPRPGEMQSLLAIQLARSSTGGESASALHPSQVLLQHLHHRLAPAPQPLLLPADAPLHTSDAAAKAIAAALAVVQPQEPSLPQKQHAQPGAHPPADIVAAAVVCLSAPDGGVDGAAQALARYVLSSFMRVPE